MVNYYCPHYTDKQKHSEISKLLRVIQLIIGKARIMDLGTLITGIWGFILPTY